MLVELLGIIVMVGIGWIGVVLGCFSMLLIMVFIVLLLLCIMIRFILLVIVVCLSLVL